MLERLCREETGKAMPEIAVTERGKPYFPGSPLHFSITHTPRHAFCVLSDAPVGIDAEELDRNVSLKLAPQLLSAHELAQFKASPDPRRALLTFWVLKEAAAKLAGTGLTGFPSQTRFDLNDPRIREMDGCLVAVMEQEK